MNIAEINQPVIVNIHQKTGNKIILIPELCQMTGLSDSMRCNFSLMKDLSSITNSGATQRVDECQQLIQMFKKHGKCQEEMENWQVEISQEPVEISANKLYPGNLIMGKTSQGIRFEFDLETSNNNEIDRKI